MAIVARTASISVPEVGDKGELPHSLPTLFVPDVLLTIETLSIVAPYALTMALVSLLESLLTRQARRRITDTGSHKSRDALGHGAADVITGLSGGMGGCATIGQTMMNVKVSAARTRISTFLVGLFLLLRTAPDPTGLPGGPGPTEWSASTGSKSASAPRRPAATSKFTLVRG